MAKKAEKNSPQLWKSARYYQTAILLLGVLLLIISLGGFALIRHVTRIQDQHLDDYLAPVALGITTPPRDAFWLLPVLFDPETGELNELTLYEYEALRLEDWDTIAASMRSYETFPYVSKIHLLSPAGEIIMNSAGEIVPLEERNRFAQRDAEAIRAAAETGAIQSLEMDDDRFMIKRLYAPVYFQESEDSDAQLAGILRVEADYQYSRTLRRLRRNVLLGFIITNTLLILLYIFTTRLVRKSIESERAMQQADRLRALGTLTAGIAHEIRNPLGILSLQIEEMRSSLSGVKDDKLRDFLDETTRDMTEETRRLKTLTESFLQFSRDAESTRFQPVSVDVAEVVPPLVKMWSKGISPEKRDVAYHCDAAKTAALFQGDRLRQVLLNLLQNADEVLGDQQGKIRVQISERGQWLEISISDNGPGIPKDLREQIFDPFYTTRAEGTGLGLPLSRAMVRKAGGDLIVEDAEGGGAKFILRLKKA